MFKCAKFHASYSQLFFYNWFSGSCRSTDNRSQSRSKSSSPALQLKNNRLRATPHWFKCYFEIAQTRFYVPVFAVYQQYRRLGAVLWCLSHRFPLMFPNVFSQYTPSYSNLYICSRGRTSTGTTWCSVDLNVQKPDVMHLAGVYFAQPDKARGWR